MRLGSHIFMADLLGHHVVTIVRTLVNVLGELILCDCDASVVRHDVCLRYLVIVALKVAVSREKLNCLEGTCGVRWKMDREH